MSLAVEVNSSSRNNMGFDETKEGADKNVISGTIVSSSNSNNNNNNNNRDSKDAVCDERKKLTRQASDSSNYATEDEEEEGRMIELGPQCTLKEQLEKDKEDESLRRWKERLLGSVDLTSVGEILEPDVKILSLAILSPGRPEILLQIPEVGNPKGLWFTLKEGSQYSLKFTFKVSNNIVSGLRYTNQVWKTGVKLIKADEMLGAFSPQAEPFTHQMPEETTPSGIFARGTYSARTKFVDDDKKCYLEINYTFDIRKDWA